MSYSERAHTACTSLFPPFSNQMVIEGSGRIDTKQLQAAVEQASAVNPGSRLILKGSLWMSTWVDSSSPPRVRVVDAGTWSGFSSESAPFLLDSFDILNGPTCEVLMVKGNPLRIIFRSHHGVMDGRGTLSWAQDIFRVLRGEKPLGSFSDLRDVDIAHSIQKNYRKPFPRDSIAPTGKTDGDIITPRWQRTRVSGNHSRLVSQIAVLLAREARFYAQGSFWIAIPVDLRQRKKGLRSTANLTTVIYTEVKPSSSPRDVDDTITSQLENYHDGLLDRFDSRLLFIPLGTITKLIKYRCLSRYRINRYGYSAMISNLGRLNQELFHGGGFLPDTVFFIPPGGASPLMVTLTGFQDTVEILFSAPELLATNDRLEILVQHVAKGLVSHA